MNSDLERAVSDRSVRYVGAVAACGLLSIAVVDVVTGAELSLSLFYLAPISLFAWRTGAWGGIAASAAGAIVWYAADKAAGNADVHPLIPLWNSLIRLGFFVIVSLLLVYLHGSMQRERSLARTDPLTGLLNRRSFEDLASREIERARRVGMPLCFAYIDLDDFKQVNDKLGHAAGDEALITAARAIDLVLRHVDLKARLGGDEFALLMADTPAEAATDVIDRMAAGLVAAGVAASIGTVVFESPPSDVAAALAAVDELMYEVKGSRFRRVAVRVVSGPTTPFSPDPVSA